MSVREDEPCVEAVAQRALPVREEPQVETGMSSQLSALLTFGTAQLQSSARRARLSTPPPRATPAMLKEQGLFDTGMSWVEREENAEKVRIDAMKQVRDAAMSAAELRHHSGTGGEYETARRVAITRFNDYRSTYWCGKAATGKDATAMQVGDSKLEVLYDGYEADVYKNATGIDIAKLDVAAQPVAKLPADTGGLDQELLQTLKELTIGGERVAVKLMGGKTIPPSVNKTRDEEEKKQAWKVASMKMENEFDEYYKHLQDQFPPGTMFDFYTDGDPPDKEDDWKLFVAYASSKAGNTLTIVKNSDDDLDKKIAKWENKGVPFVKAEVAPYPRKFTLDKTKAVVVVNIAPTTAVFDATAVPDAMLDGDNFKTFQIVDGHWKVHNVANSNRLIIEPEGLADTDVLDREVMKEHLSYSGVDYMVVKSQGKIELEEDVATYEATRFNEKFAVYMKPEHHSEQTRGRMPGGAFLQQKLKDFNDWRNKGTDPDEYTQWCKDMRKLAKKKFLTPENNDEYNRLFEQYKEMVNKHNTQGSDSGYDTNHRDQLQSGKNAQENFEKLLKGQYKSAWSCSKLTKPSEIKSSAAADEDVGGMELCCDEEDTGNYLSDRKKQGQALFESVMHGKNTNNKNGLCEKRLDNYDELQREIDDKCFERENAMKESREKMVIFKRAARAYALNNSGDNFNAAFAAYRSLRHSYFGENAGSYSQEYYRKKFDEIMEQFQSDKKVGALKFKDPTMIKDTIPSVNLEEVFAQEAATGCGFNYRTRMRYPCGFVVTEFASDGSYTCYCVSGKSEEQYLDEGRLLKELDREHQTSQMDEVIEMLQTLLEGPHPDYHRVIVPSPPSPPPPSPPPSQPDAFDYLANYLGVRINDDEEVKRRLQARVNTPTRYVIPFNSHKNGFDASDDSRIEDITDELEERKNQLLLTYKPPEDEPPAQDPDRFAAAPESPYNDLDGFATYIRQGQGK